MTWVCCLLQFVGSELGGKNKTVKMLPATFMFFSGSSTLRSHPSMPTTLTCCHGDEGVYFAIASTKAYTPTYCHGDEGVYFALTFTKA